MFDPAFVRLLLLLCLANLAASCQTPPGTPPPVSKSERQDTTASTGVPQPSTRGPSEIKKVSPIIDADFTDELLDIFKDSEECSGIAFYISEKKTPPDFRVRMTFNQDDVEPEWLWTVLDAKHGDNGELRGIGNQASATLAVRDMCVTVWEDVDPNHYKRPSSR